MALKTFNPTSAGRRHLIQVDRSQLWKGKPVKALVEGLFGVKVKSVNTLVRKGKQRRFKGQLAMLSDVKKAYVTLEEGQRLDVTTGL